MKCTKKSLIHSFPPTLLPYAANLQTSVVYLSTPVCSTVLLVNLIYGLVAHVTDLLHIIAELRKSEKKWMVLKLYLVTTHKTIT